MGVLEAGRLVKIRLRWLTTVEVVTARIVKADAVGVEFRRASVAEGAEFAPWTSVVTVATVTTGGE